MTDTGGLEVAVTAPVSTVLRQTGRSGTADLDARAGHYMAAFHDRHVPLPPGLARTLVQMERARCPADDPKLGRAWDLAAVSLGRARALGRNETWALLTWAFALLVVEPLLRQVTLRIGTLYLTGQSDIRASEADRIGDDWEIYESRMLRELDSLLAAPEEMGASFWAYAGIALLAAFDDAKRRPARDAQTQALRLPFRTNSLLPALVLVSEPELEAGNDTARPPQRMTQRAQRDRTAIRPREGGVTGILQTRRIEDLNDALPSTFLMPPLLRTIRLMEEGYPITNRPPQRTPARDLLSMAFHDGAQAHPPALIAKAAWIDAVLRLRFILSGMGHAKSELGWYDTKMRSPAAALSAGEVAVTRGLDPLMLSGDPRRMMVTSSALFPEVFAALPATTRAGDSATRAVEDAGDSDPLGPLLDATACAAASVRTPGRRKAGPPTPRRFEPEAYGRRFLLHITQGIVSGDELQPAWQSEKRDLLRRYRMPQTLSCHVAMMLLPAMVEPGGPAFRLLSDSSAETISIGIDPDLNPDEALNHLLGQLSRWFIDQTLEAVHG